MSAEPRDPGRNGVAPAVPPAASPAPEEPAAATAREATGDDPAADGTGTGTAAAHGTGTASVNGTGTAKADGTGTGKVNGAVRESAGGEAEASGAPRRRTGRFPRFTRDTARPEGGGRAAPGDAPAPARQWPILAVLGVTALGLLLTALDVFRVGILLIGVALLAGGVLRWVLPGVGMLAVRSRFTDICTYGALGGAIVLLALMAQPDPWVQIPFLKDTLHFTVGSGG
ncbi:DUF3017 domain-containing protein [Streptomyces sp. NPDC087425]|uniref:DUF3017 domain-containing protein n=1 Tax=Streptomyces sp. NPDC087425 TaxID=3365787 RepID=UPI00380AED8B